MGPSKIAHTFRERTLHAEKYRISRHGIPVLTGKGHLTDSAVVKALTPI